MTQKEFITKLALNDTSVYDDTNIVKVHDEHPSCLFTVHLQFRLNSTGSERTYHGTIELTQHQLLQYNTILPTGLKPASALASEPCSAHEGCGCDCTQFFPSLIGRWKPPAQFRQFQLLF
jgi:hypothetical protein